MYRLGCIGIGNMGNAMVSGAVNSGLFAADDVIVSASSQNTLQKYPTFHKTTNNCEVCQSEIVLLAVKPHSYAACLEEIRDCLPEDAILVTMAPGFSLDQAEDIVGKKKIVRSMPNMPALIGEGMTGISFNDFCTDSDKKKIVAFFRSFGEAKEVEERFMGAVCAASGSSPAFVFVLIEAMADACVKMGMKRQDALMFCAKSVEGAAKTVLQSGQSPASLKDAVCSPQGTTIEGVLTLERTGFRAAIQEALIAAYHKAESMK